MKVRWSGPGARDEGSMVRADSRGLLSASPSLPQGQWGPHAFPWILTALRVALTASEGPRAPEG